jgi:hypothetical protein
MGISFRVDPSGIVAISDSRGLLLRREPFLNARSPIKHLTANARPWRPNAKHVPTVKRALVSPQLGGEFFRGEKFFEDRFRVRHSNLFHAV